MAVNTIKVGPGTLTIGAAAALTSFSSQVTSVKLVPSADQDDSLYVLSGESVAGDRSESFTLEGTLLQDFGATGAGVTSTTEWLFNHRGETHVFEFQPSTAAAKKVTGSLVVEAVDIGGDVNAKATSDFTFTLVGAPEIASVS